jgi:hypothetical protein
MWGFRSVIRGGLSGEYGLRLIRARKWSKRLAEKMSIY